MKSEEEYISKHYPGLSDSEINLLSHYKVLQDKESGHYRNLTPPEQEEFDLIKNKLQANIDERDSVNADTGIKGKKVWYKYSKSLVKGSYNYNELEFLGAFSQETFEEDIKQYLDRTKWDEISRTGDNGENHSYPNNPYGNYSFWDRNEKEQINYYLGEIAAHGKKVDWQVGDSVFVPDVVSKNKKGTIKSINGTTYQVDFGNGDKYGIEEHRLGMVGHDMIGKTIRIHSGMPYMASLANLTDKDLKVLDVKTIDFASGAQTFYVVKSFDGDVHEIPERFINPTAAKGIKLNEMKNNYYYLKIGNFINENGAIYEIVSHRKDGIGVRRFSKIEKDTPEHGMYFDRIPNMLADKTITIESFKEIEGVKMAQPLIYETDRDKVLLNMEIDNIQASFKESELKANVENIKAETSQVKKEADILLNKLEEKTKGFEDTMAGVEALDLKDPYDKKLNEFLSKYPSDAKSWAQADDGIRELAKDVRSAYNEQVLDVLEGEPGYVEGLNFKEFGKPHQWNTEAKKFILKYWALLPENVKKHTFFADGRWFGKEEASKGKKIDSDFHIGEVVRVTKGHYKGKNGTISDLDADKNHVEVTMGDEMVRFLELADIKKIEPNAKPTKMVSNPKAKKGAKIEEALKSGDIGKAFKAIVAEDRKNGNKKAKYTKTTKKLKGPKRGTTTLSERNYMKSNKKEFTTLKDAYPDSTYRELIAKHKKADKKSGGAEYDSKGALKLTEAENDAWENAFNDGLDNGLSDSKADKEAAKAIIAKFPRLKELLKGKTKISTEIAD